MPSTDILWVLGALMVLVSTISVKDVPWSMQNDLSELVRTLKRIERLLEEEKRERGRGRRY